MSRRDYRRIVCSALGLAGIFGLGGQAFASGYALREGSADWLGTAFAGDTAKAYDASTAWTNPAGMARLEESEIDGDIAYIAPDAKFTGQNFLGPQTVVSGTQGGNDVQAAASGGVFGVWAISPDFRLGFGATAPFAQRVTNPYNFVGRYQSLVSSITDIAGTLALSWKVNDHLSIGGGPVVDYFHARLTQAIDIGLNPLVGDPIADVHGDNVGVGYNLGLLYQIDDRTRLGLDYRSSIRHGIDGQQEVSVPSLLKVIYPPAAYELGALSGAASTSVVLPASVSVGIYHDLTPELAIMADAQWTQWSVLQQLTVSPANGAPATVLPENWHDTAFAAIGVNYRVSDRVMLQGGFNYDESPVTDANRTTRIPDADHYTLAGGVDVTAMPGLDLQLAYSHIFTPGGTIESSANATSGLIDGSYATSADTVTIGFRYKFGS